MVRLMKWVAAGIFGLTMGVSGASAQGYPTRPITLIVPYSAGGPSDAIARLLGQSMSATLGQQLVIEPVVGAGGTTGAGRLAKSAPDGYTLLIHHVALAASASLYASLAYDTNKAFETIGLINYGPMVLLSKKDYGAANIAELIAKVKADGTKTTIAHAGVGSNSYLCAQLLQKAMDVKMTDVGYRGTGPAMNDLMGGQVDLLCEQSTTAVPQIKGGTVKPFAVTSAKRMEILKDLPTLQEAGLKDFDFVIWHGLYAPKGTPADIVTKLNGALQKALEDPTIQSRFADVGTSVFPPADRGPDVHLKMFEKEIGIWKTVIDKPVQ
ncbi:tripartite tricarboxylate transporter substrate-binding protein [Aquabacter cavernae]|uniref:tripartite tricarboxylate transporter substrate-binding protein n=1 Tax=Aquabacter cavernae TaxID=2496029 RepID=UPI000F8CC633|nr:tripartite tricarboxylate transporter substrate-binding protein [Aquabacter cavernae]